MDIRFSDKELATLSYTEDTLNLLTDANVRQLDQINKLDAQCQRQQRTISFLSQDQPLAAWLMERSGSLEMLIGFGSATAMWLIIQWVLL